METYSEWKWSEAHQLYYMYKYGDDGVIIETLWEDGSQKAPTAEQSGAPDYLAVPNSYGQNNHQSYNTISSYNPGHTATSSFSNTHNFTNSNDPYNSTVTANQLTPSHDPYSSTVTANRLTTSYDPYSNTVKANQRRPSNDSFNNTVMQADSFDSHHDDRDQAEVLDPSYERIPAYRHSEFFKAGRVFKMLWSEPAAAEPQSSWGGPTSNYPSTGFSEPQWSEIRRFIVVRNKGSFSQCVPISTHPTGTTKRGRNQQDHGIIHTTRTPPAQLPGEHLTKTPIYVRPSKSTDTLPPESRVNYGKIYAVEHNVKVHEIGMVDDDQLSLIYQYSGEETGRPGGRGGGGGYSEGSRSGNTPSGGYPGSVPPDSMGYGGGGGYPGGPRPTNNPYTASVPPDSMGYGGGGSYPGGQRPGNTPSGGYPASVPPEVMGYGGTDEYYLGPRSGNNPSEAYASSGSAEDRGYDGYGGSRDRGRRDDSYRYM